MNLKFQLWVPFLFCAALCWMGSISDLYSFLPMCFLGMAVVQLSLLKRIEKLESERQKS